MRTIRTTVEITIPAPPERVAALFTDFRRWPQIFPSTIQSTELRRRGSSLIEVMVHHRHEGDVINVLVLRSPDTVELREFKRRFDAVFVNRFLSSSVGTRYVIEAEIRLKGGYALLAPFLRRFAERALRRYVLEPMRSAATANTL
jgi:hypothetical protein